MNTITIVGNLTSDPELRFTPSGKPVANFTVAVNEGTGENEKTHFVPVAAWDSLGENVADSLRRGNRVIVSGRFTSRKATFVKSGGEGTWEGSTLELTATAVGPDLRWAKANPVKVVREHAPAEAPAVPAQTAPAVPVSAPVTGFEF